MKIFSCDKIHEIDRYTITNEPVESTDLMERAASRLFEWFIQRFGTEIPVLIFVGPGNNGGDGLALARMLAGAGYTLKVFSTGEEKSASPDWKINRGRLQRETNVPCVNIKDSGELPEISSGSIVVDAIFGSGLSRKVTGLPAEIIRRINNSGATVVSVDIPSGLFGEDNSENDPEAIIRANYTLTFQFPKLSFMFAGNDKFTGKWFVLPIGLRREIIEKTPTPYSLVDGDMLKPLLKQRNKFAHKGTFGHGLLVGGSYGRMGAVVLGARAALRSGIGLITCHIPACGNFIVQCSVPEAMTIHDRSEHIISGIGDTSVYSACAAGPGMGTSPETTEALRKFIGENRKPLVLDADALNIISSSKQLLELIPPMTILTPHPGEFERLAGKTTDAWHRLMRQREFSTEHNCVVVLKGYHTSVSDPSGNVWFNSTGNAGMATAGSGDTMTGIILSLLAQGYEPVNAALISVYLHGLAGDIAGFKRSPEALIASDITENLGEAFNRIRTS